MVKIVILTVILCLTGDLQGQSGLYGEWVKVTGCAGFQTRSDHQVIIFKDQAWLIGGLSKEGKPLRDIWKSSDMINWEPVKTGLQFEGGSAVVFQGRIWMINTNGKNIWNSADGFHWEKVCSIGHAPAYGTKAVVFRDKIWLTGGADVKNEFLPGGELNPDRKVIWKNDVWSSANGRDWKKEETVGCFTERSHHSAIVFDCKLWVLCGQSGPNKNDIWNSVDGIRWKLVANAPFIPRHVCEAVSFNNEIWVIGGFAFNNENYPVLLDDVWHSSDGITWEQIPAASVSIGARMEHKVTCFGNKLWLTGGQCGIFPDQLPRNDIWCFGK